MTVESNAQHDRAAGFCHSELAEESCLIGRLRLRDVSTSLNMTKKSNAQHDSGARNRAAVHCHSELAEESRLIGRLRLRDVSTSLNMTVESNAQHDRAAGRTSLNMTECCHSELAEESQPNDTA